MQHADDGSSNIDDVKLGSLEEFPILIPAGEQCRRESDGAANEIRHSVRGRQDANVAAVLGDTAVVAIAGGMPIPVITTSTRTNSSKRAENARVGGSNSGVDRRKKETFPKSNSAPGAGYSTREQPRPCRSANLPDTTNHETVKGDNSRYEYSRSETSRGCNSNNPTSETESGDANAQISNDWFDLSDFVRKKPKKFFVGGFTAYITESKLAAFVRNKGPKVTQVSIF